ncbi:MAG TPA: serine hydrolase domain-containing protein [Kofleriaceae bacterium]|nr:serine hydrolase domain-containing protein [Kofleriaceae bacterium]
MQRLEPEIAAIIDDALRRHVGSAVAVSIGDAGAEVVRVVRGHTRRIPELGAPVDDGTYFDVASLTKPMATVACAMVLTEARILDLDAPIRHWLPTASSTGTVRQLLGHGAGCAAHVEFFRRLRSNPTPDPRRELVQMAAAEAAVAPGTGALYSDLGYIMLGAIIERAADAPLEHVFADLVAGPLGLVARYAGTTPVPGAVSTELDDRGLVTGLVHDENAYYGGGACGHAGLFATIGDVAAFAAAIVDTAAGRPRGRFTTELVHHFATTAVAPRTSWRLGWDTPSPTSGVSHAGDRWPRTGSIGHLGFTGTSLWLDLPRRRWVALLANRVHPTRGGSSAEEIKALRRAVNDRAIELLPA